MTRHRTGACGLATLCWLAMAAGGAAVAAEGPATVRATLAGDFHEVVQEEVSVSGSVVVGVAAAGASSGPAALSGLTIPAAASRVCLTVLSRDGVYFARNAYDVPEQPAGAGPRAVLLPFDATRRGELIRGFGAGEISVRATAGDCDVESPVYLVAAAAQGYAAVEVLINAFGATDVYFRTASGADGECLEFLDGRRTSFDYRCEIPMDALGSGRQRVFIERERYGRPLSEVDIELEFGAGS